MPSMRSIADRRGSISSRNAIRCHGGRSTRRISLIDLAEDFILDQEEEEADVLQESFNHKSMWEKMELVEEEEEAHV